MPVMSLNPSLGFLLLPSKANLRFQPGKFCAPPTTRIDGALTVQLTRAACGTTHERTIRHAAYWKNCGAVELATFTK